ncbi:hypothetical protein O181_055713 [Austropuccinia psidii MF-1]|uniref:Uncharacterized protein n=1 Tax=Austropuccinia psidii MF-1 TaxID=1389203 RepID=A0A9Q3EBR3_9BASI|nr:hypothetical protein [Austropuccinia psidii MF-1]
MLAQYNLKTNIISIITDKAYINSRMANEIQAITNLFCAKTQAIGFMAHTIQLASLEGISELSQPTQELPVGTERLNRTKAISSLNNQPDGYNLNYNSIILGSTFLSSYLHQSPQKRKSFSTTVKLIHDDED